MRMRQRSKFIKDIVYAGITNIAISLKAIVLLPILAKYLGAQEYGIFTQVKTTLTIMIPLMVMGLENAVITFLAGSDDKRYLKDSFFKCLYLSLAASLFFVFVFNIYHEAVTRFIFRDAQLAYLIKPLSVMLVLYSLDYLINYFFVARRFIWQQALFTVCEFALEIASIFWVLRAGHGIAAVIYCLMSVKLVFMACRFAVILSNIGIALPDFRNAFKFLRFSLPLMVSLVFYFIINLGDRYIIGNILDLRQVGVYSVGYTIGSVVIIAMAPFEYIFYPMISDLWGKGQRLKIRYYLAYTVKLSFVIALPITVLIIFLSHYLVLLFSTEEFISARFIIPFVAAAFLINGPGVIGEHIIAVSKSTHIITGIYFFLVLFNIAGNILLVGKMGILGAAVITLLTYMMYTALIFFFVRRRIEFRLEAGLIFKYGLSIIPMVLLGTGFIMSGLPVAYLAAALALGALLYFEILRRTGIINRDDYRIFKSVFVS